MSRDSLTDKLTDHLVDSEAKSLRRTFSKKHQEMARITNLLRETVGRLQAQGLANHEPLWNTCLYLNLASHDLSILVQELSLQRDEWHRKLVARHLALLIYETTEDIRALLGKTFKNALQSLGLLERYEAELHSVRKPLGGFWDNQQKALKQIRIASVAHREHDALATLSVIESIDVHELLELGIGFNTILNGIASSLSRIVSASSQVAP